MGNWTLTYDSNAFGGGATPAAQPTWGQLKAGYRPDAPAAPQDK